MTLQNVRGAYFVPTHDRAQDWDFFAKWQPNVIRLMLHGSHSDPASVSVPLIRRVHETCPDALILLRVWDVDDRNFEAHAAMVANPNAEAEKQLDWWARLFDRIQVQGVPRKQLMAGLNNETGPEKDGALYPYTERALTLGTERGVRCGGLVFSVGRPSLPGESEYDMDYFSRLEPLFLAGDHAELLHEYLQPEGMYAVWTDAQGNERKDYTYLVGRHKRWPMKRVKKIIAEWGIDGILYNRHPHPEFGNSGWRHFRDLWPPDRYADEYVECTRVADESVIATCPYLEDYADRKWASFDLLDAYAQFIARKDLCVRDIAPTKPFDTRLPVVISPPLTQPNATVTAPAGANVRTGPGTNYPIRGAEPYMSVLPVTGRSADGTWWQVEMEHAQGWVSSLVVSVRNTANVPVVAVEPVTPQPQPQPSVPQLAHPIADVTKRIISQPFGADGHTGIDYAVVTGTPIGAADAGVVQESGVDAEGYGEYVKLRHSWGESIYAHLKTRRVQAGEAVNRGNVIGNSGSTGNSTGPHLHFAIRIYPYNRADGRDGFSDPAPYLETIVPPSQPLTNIVQLIRDAAREFGVDPDLLLSLIWAESSFVPGAININSGASGLGQIMIPTWDEWAARVGARDIFNPVDNARVTAAYLAWCIDQADGAPYGLLAYNWGIGNFLSGKAAPKETIEYANKVLHGRDLLKAVGA